MNMPAKTPKTLRPFSFQLSPEMQRLDLEALKTFSKAPVLAAYLEGEDVESAFYWLHRGALETFADKNGGIYIRITPAGRVTLNAVEAYGGHGDGDKLDTADYHG